MLSTILAIALAIVGFAVLAVLVALVVRRLGLFGEEGTTLQISAIVEPRPLPTLPGPGVEPSGPRLRETSVAAWASRVISLQAAKVTIGRALANTVVLSDDPVSAEHCRIERDGSAFRLVDLDSTNGTWVNGNRVDNVILRRGDQIRVGRTTFVFEDEGGPPLPL